MNPTSPDLWSRSWKILHPGEATLACGLVTLLVSALLFSLVMLGLLAFITAPVALLFLLNGILRARNRSAPARQQAMGMLLVLLSMIALGAVTLFASELGAKLALQIQRSKPAPLFTVEWLGMAGSGLIPALFLAPGLRRWAGWSPRRCLVWGGIVMIVPPTILLFFKFMALTLPLSA